MAYFLSRIHLTFEKQFSPWVKGTLDGCWNYPSMRSRVDEKNTSIVNWLGLKREFSSQAEIICKPDLFWPFGYWTTPVFGSQHYHIDNFSAVFIEFPQKNKNAFKLNVSVLHWGIKLSWKRPSLVDFTWIWLRVESRRKFWDKLEISSSLQKYFLNLHSGDQNTEHQISGYMKQYRNV